MPSVIAATMLRSAVTVDGSRLRLEAALRDAIADGDAEAAAAAASALALRNQRTALASKAKPADRSAALAPKAADGARIAVEVRVVDTSFVDIFADDKGIPDEAHDAAAQELLAVYMHYFSHEIDAVREAVRYHVREALQAELDDCGSPSSMDEGAAPSEDAEALVSALRRRLAADAGIAVHVLPVLANPNTTSVEAMRLVRAAATDAAVEAAVRAPAKRPGGRMRNSAPLSKEAREARPRLLEAARGRLLAGALPEEELARLQGLADAYVEERARAGVVVDPVEARELLLRDAAARARTKMLTADGADIPPAATYDVGVHDDTAAQFAAIRSALRADGGDVDQGVVMQAVSRRVLRELNAAAARGAKLDLLGAETDGDGDPVEDQLGHDADTHGAEVTPMAAAARAARDAAKARREAAQERDRSLAFPLPPFGAVLRLRVSFVPRPTS